MAKPRHGGGPRPSASILKTDLLEQRISDAGLTNADPSIVVAHLRSSFSDYNRLKYASLLISVTELLQHLRRSSSASHDEDEDRMSGNHRSNPSSTAMENYDSASTSALDDEALHEALQAKPDTTSGARPSPASSAEICVATNVAAKEKQIRGSGGAAVDAWPRFRDIGGIKEDLREELMMGVIAPLLHPVLQRRLGFTPVSGILLHGPPGCGKTMLAHAIANEARVPFYNIPCTKLVSGTAGKSEANIRVLFEKAHCTAPSIIFLDEIDAIASKRGNIERSMEIRIVTQLLTCIDSFHLRVGSNNAGPYSKTNEEKHRHVLVIGATNRPDALDESLRRPGRFDQEIMLGFPDENARVEILSVLTRNHEFEGNINLLKIARFTPGFVAGDLEALVNKAGNLAMRRIMKRRKSELSNGSEDNDNEDWLRRPWNPKEIESVIITMVDFEEAAKIVQPSSKREGFSSTPNVKWEDVGGLNSMKIELDRCIVQRIKNPKDYENFGVNLEDGFLLYGPPGCGKTLFAKAAANEAGANFIHIKGPELLNKYVGESERAIRTIFSRARTCSPCILFFDEVDALTHNRGKEGGHVVERIVNQLLIELDGSDQRQGVYVIGATNRLDVIDPALLRPGRFRKLLYVPLPGPDERVLILKTLARKKHIDADVDFDAIGHSEACENFSGSDLAAMMHEAAMAALEEKQRSKKGGNPYNEECLISSLHFDQALRNTSPSVSEEQRSYYEAFSEKFRGA